MKCKEIMSYLEQLSPLEYACEWDNVGLLAGHIQQEVHTILVALDPTLETINEAVAKNADMVITHHPLIFKNIKQITEQSACGRKVLALMEHRIAYYAMHTNFDVLGGMAQIAADKLGIKVLQPLEESSTYNNEKVGIGCIGSLDKKLTLLECAELVKSCFGIPSLRVYGEKNQMLETVALCPGSGKSMIDLAKQKGAQVLITGDIGHHEGMDAVEMGISVIDASHYGLEHIFTEFIKEYLEKKCPEITVYAYDSKSPFWIV